MSNQDILSFSKQLLPDTLLVPGESFFWSPKKNKITYKTASISESIGVWSMLHEISHALLNHTSYDSDLGLLKLEVEAWDEAEKLAKDIGIEISDNHIQDCLDTYRDWLHRRSSCPNCNIICLQSSSIVYKCHNCATSWNVSASRFCRPYRLQINEQKQEKSQLILATFQ